MKPSEKFKISSPKSLASQVAERLREAIIEGDFELGSMIPEELLATQFGVSRTPVREALSQLQIAGLVVVKPQRGSFVFKPTPGDVEALYQFRCVIEPSAAEFAWKINKNRTLDAMQLALENMLKSKKKRDALSYGRADTRFHECVFENCGNPYLQSAYAVVAAKIATLRTRLSAPADIFQSTGFEQHSRLISLFDEGNFAQYRMVMSEHVRGTRDNYLARIKDSEKA
jgi:DNA-binding GntR family transcriptional regulator